MANQCYGTQETEISRSVGKQINIVEKEVQKET